jgi:phenylpropionate dioxygenase-like ring-hydroxylating dioxygenase large terminal subunit
MNSPKKDTRLAMAQKIEPVLTSINGPGSEGTSPPTTRFATYPVSWYYFCSVLELERGPVSRDLFGRRLVVFRTDSGRIAALEARCSHLAADLGCGQVVGEAIRCPFHHWEYGTDGKCSHLPASREIPGFARQQCFPIKERHGYLYVFNGSQALFPLPFYPDVEPADLICGDPFVVELGCPWFMVGANAFDAQHFRGAHDRELQSEPQIECPTPYSRRARARFGVVGDSLQDRLTRLLAGDVVDLSITDHGGNFLLATATFQRTRTYGMVVTTPLAESRVLVRVFVMKRRSSNPVAHFFLDRLSLAVRRKFINEFLATDIVNLAGVGYDPARLISADQIMAEYFQWLAVASHGHPQPAVLNARPSER